MSNPTAEKPAGAAPPPKPVKPGIGEALRKILTGPDDTDESKQIARRRRFVMASVLGFLGVNLVMFLRFFLPRTLFEPKTSFTIGYPSDFGFGVDTKFQNAYRIWVVRNTEGIFVISAICTHLDARRIGKLVKTNSNVLVTAAATIRKASTSKVLRRGRWTAPMSSSIRRVRFLWI